MSPALLPREKYLASCLLKPKIGKFVVFYNPKYSNQIMVKQIIDKTDNGWLVSGINPLSTSVAKLGEVENHNIIGVLIKRANKR